MLLHHRIDKNTPGAFLLLSQGVFAGTMGYILPLGDLDNTLEDMFIICHSYCRIR